MVLQPMEAEDIPQGKYNMAKRINYSEVFLSFYITYYYCIVLAHSFSTVRLSHYYMFFASSAISHFHFTALKETCTIPMAHLRHTE